MCVGVGVGEGVDDGVSDGVWLGDGIDVGNAVGITGCATGCRGGVCVTVAACAERDIVSGKVEAWDWQAVSKKTAPTTKIKR